MYLLSLNDHQDAEEVESDETRTPHKLVNVPIGTIYFA